MSKLVKANEKIAEKVIEGYKKIESGAVSGYQKIEDGVAESFGKVVDKCVDALFAKDGKTTEEARARLSGQEKPKEESDPQL